jgi:hypothetical protein
MCQSSFGRFCVNTLHSDDPLDRETIKTRLNNLLEHSSMKGSDDYIKIDNLIKQFEKDSHSIEQLLHLYTLETKFYGTLRKDCLPLAIPLFVHLPRLKERFFQGRVYRGVHMTYEQFAHMEAGDNEKKGLSVLFIFDFPNVCDQAINLARISVDSPSLSEYEKEVLILPWTLFEVTNVQKATDADDLCTVHLTNIMIPKKDLISSFKWSYLDLKNHIIKENKLIFDCAFQKYKPH